MKSSKFVFNKGLRITGSDIIKAHTINKTSAFVVSLILTVLFNYSNSLANEPTKKEFLPSIKDSISGAYPIKAIFQLQIGIQSFLELTHHLLVFLTVKSINKSIGTTIGVLGIVRLVSLSSFSYITFDDDPTTFTNSYVLYTLSTFAWIYILETKLISNNPNVKRIRRFVRNSYGGLLILSAFFFYKHQVEHVSYTYSISAIFQWLMIGLDVYFDSLLSFELVGTSLDVDFPDTAGLHKHIV